MTDEIKQEPLTLYVLRRRFRAALAYATIDAGAWASASPWTIQHLNACLRGDRPITPEMREALETFIGEQFRLMREEEGADVIADVVIRSSVSEFLDLFARAIERYIERGNTLDENTPDEEQIREAGKKVGQYLLEVYREDREQESLEREKLQA